MKEYLDYAEVFEKIIQKTSEYLLNNDIKAMILGISGGIDSTVCAAICHEVSKKTGIPLIGRCLPTRFNKKEETTVADLVGKAFCNDYKIFQIDNIYQDVRDEVVEDEKQTKLADGNIQARLRMIYLYNLASIYSGLVIDTDNLTENNLGYFTIHGDMGDFNPIGGLWKTEVFKLAEYLHERYSIESYYHETYSDTKNNDSEFGRCIAISKSLKLKPTAGLGITDSDLEEIGAESYEQVDYILQELLAWKWLSEKRGDKFDTIWAMRDGFLEEQQMLDTPIEVIIAVTDRHFKSEFKRNKLPVKIDRSLYS